MTFLDLVLVFAAGDIFQPSLIVEILLHGLADASFETSFGLPVEFAVDFAGIDGVVAVAA